MSLFAIGDLHLHFQSELKAPGQLTNPVWKSHEERFLNNCRRMIGPEDTLLLAGDHSWGRNMAECEQDFAYILALPGRKILLRGNHDMFWDAKKTAALNERFAGKLFFLQNNYAAYQDFALVGTKGFTFEGPFFLDRKRRVVGWDEEEAARAEKLVEREAERLRVSFEAAKRDGYTKFIMFLPQLWSPASRSVSSGPIIRRQLFRNRSSWFFHTGFVSWPGAFSSDWKCK